MKIDMKKNIMSIARSDEKKRMMHTQLTSKEVLTQVSIIEIEDEDSFDEKKVLQAIINEEMKKNLKVER